jgi:flagellar hook-basal body complex protein FliE
MNPISGVPAPTTPPLPPGPPALPPADNNPQSFKNLLLEGIQQVNQMQHNADQAVEHLLAGGDTDPAMVLTAVQKADMSFRMMMQIRNKLVQAFQEIKEIRI